MKKILFFCLLTACSLCFWSCGDDDEPAGGVNEPKTPVVDPNTPVPDPAGTITANISDGTSISIWGIESYSFGYITWRSPDNFSIGHNYSGLVSICNLGIMNGLGNITSIPQIGYTIPQSSNREVACETGNGYVIKFEGGNLESPLYVRLYVEGTIVSTTGGIMGAKVKYQYPFEPTTLTLSKETISFPTSGGSEIIKIITDASEWNYFCVEDWINITKDEDNLSITVLTSKSISERTANIVIQAAEKQKDITVTQEAITKTQSPYAIGDVFCENGVKGVVYKITDNGEHGMIVSLDETQCQWSTSFDDFGNSDVDNGLNNMSVIKQLPNWQGRFPAFKWCDDKNTENVSGWYLPAKNELAELYAGYCGLSEFPGAESDAETVYRKGRDRFNEILTNNGGNIISEDYYWSSSGCRSSENYPRAWHQTFSNGYQSDYCYQSPAYRVRAVCAF